MNIFGSKKATVEEYKSDMPLLTPGNQIVVSFDELAGGTDNKYKGKYKITAKKGDVTSAYVVDPNAPSVNKLVIEAIVGKLNGGKGVEPGPPGPPAELTELNGAVDELVAGIAAAAVDKITAATAKMSDAAAKISDADKSAAITKLNEAIAKVKHAIDADPPPTDSLKSALEAAQKALAEALEALATTYSLGGYNSAKSAVPKRITRIRRTRRSAKRTGTRRRLHI